MNEREIAQEIAKIPRGGCLRVSRSMLDLIGHAPLMGMFGPIWSPAERIMENIIGSSYEFSFGEDYETGDVIFFRRKYPSNTPDIGEKDDNARTYVSPDRRHFFSKGADGMFRPLQTA